MASFTLIRRVVFSHQWQDPSEWVMAMTELADLTDDEIERVVAGGDFTDPVRTAT